MSTFSRRDRFLARIEAAAKELGMRIAEYEEFLRTPEGIAEQNAALDRDRTQNRDTQATEAMDDAPADDVLTWAFLVLLSQAIFLAMSHPSVLSA